MDFGEVKDALFATSDLGRISIGARRVLTIVVDAQLTERPTGLQRLCPSPPARASMIFNSKQLEELENIHDSTGAFEEEGEDDGNFEEIGEAAMDWRRGLIEEATENIKRAKNRPVEPHLTYPIGSMLFEREARRFARVQRSVPGYLKIIYLSGGDREFGNLDLTSYLREYGAEKRLSELSEQLGMNEVNVGLELERLGITPVDEPEAEEIAVGADGAPTEPEAAVPQPSKGKGAKAGGVVATATKGRKGTEPLESKALAAANKKHTTLPGPAALPEKQAGKQAGKQHAKHAGKQPAKAETPVTAKSTTKLSEKAKAAAKPAGKTKLPEPAKKKATPSPSSSSSSSSSKINPIDDPNSYIKAHYTLMSNRELARVTGLSEHTIRRKLGEWSLRRKPT